MFEQPPATEPTKFCINCTHFTGQRWQFALEDSHGSCGYRGMLHVKTNAQCAKDAISSRVHPVTGQLLHTYAHAWADEVRRDENACGLEAKWYEQYVVPERSVESQRAVEYRKKTASNAEALLSELESL